MQQDNLRTVDDVIGNETDAGRMKNHDDQQHRAAEKQIGGRNDLAQMLQHRKLRDVCGKCFDLRHPDSTAPGTPGPDLCGEPAAATTR